MKIKPLQKHSCVKNIVKDFGNHEKSFEHIQDGFLMTILQTALTSSSEALSLIEALESSTPRPSSRAKGIVLAPLTIITQYLPCRKSCVTITCTCFNHKRFKMVTQLMKHPVYLTFHKQPFSQISITQISSDQSIT